MFKRILTFYHNKKTVTVSVNGRRNDRATCALFSVDLKKNAGTAIAMYQVWACGRCNYITVAV